MADQTLATAETEVDIDTIDRVSGWFKRTAIDVMSWVDDFEAENPEVVQSIKDNALLFVNPITVGIGVTNIVRAANAEEEQSQETTVSTPSEEEELETDADASSTTEETEADAEVEATEEQATTTVQKTVFVPDAGYSIPDDMKERIATIEAALPAMIALAEDAGSDLTERKIDVADGYLDETEIAIINEVSDKLRETILASESADLLEDDVQSQGFSDELGKVLGVGLGAELQKYLDDPSKSSIHGDINYLKDNYKDVMRALRKLNEEGLLVAAQGKFDVQEVEAPVDPSGQPVVTPPDPATSATEDEEPEVTARDTDALDLKTSIYFDGSASEDDVTEAIEAIELVQVKAYDALNDMSPFFADLMDKPTQDGQFEDGEKRNLSAMVMLMRKINGEGNPNGAFDEAKLVELREALLTDDKFEMLRQQLAPLGVQKINAGDSEEVKAQKRKDADEALFRHLLVLQQAGETDPNANSVTAANLAFDKIREYLPDSVKIFLQDMLENTSIGKMVMGVAAAKGMNLERLWKEPELQAGQTEAEYLEGKKRDFLAQGFDEYLEKAEEELKAEGADNPEFADILARAQENIKEDIEENKLSGVMKKALGDSYDELKDDLLVAVEATTGAATKEEAQKKLLASLEGVDGLELDESMRIEQRAEEIINVVGAGASVFTQSASQSTTTTLEEEEEEELTPEEEAALSSSTVNTVAAAVATSATATIPEVDQEAVDPAKVSTLGSEEHSKGVVLEYDRDPNEYVIKNVESEGRVKAILEAIAAMDEDKRPYNPEDLIRRTDDSGEIIDLAYKEHNGALEKLAVAAQLDHLISSGEDTIYMSQIEHQITSDNLPQIEAFLQKNGVPEEQVEAAVTAARSLIDQEVDGKSVMSAFFGNWDQIRISEIRALVEEIEPEREISVVEDVPEPEPFNPEHVDLSRRGGDVTLAVGPMPDTTPRPPVSDNTNLFNNVSGVDPYGACQMYSVTANTRRNTATSSGCDSRPDRYSAFRRFDPNDPDGPGEMPVDWRIFGRHTPEERFDTSTTYDKGGLNQRTAYGKDIRTVRNMFPNPGQRRLGEQVVKDFYDFREKMENDGNLNPETNHVLEQVSQRQMAILRQPGLNYSQREQEINALRQQLHDDYNAKYGSGRQVVRVEVDKENMFEPVVGKQAIGGYAAQIEDIFGGNEQMKELALEQLEGFESKVDRILESDMSPEQAKAAIQQELRTLDGNLDNLYNIKAMIDDRGIALYEQEIKDTIGEAGPYAQRAEQAIREFQERVSIISADTTFTTSEKLQDATMLHRMLEEELDTIYVEKQQEEYTIALQASDTTGTTIDPETLEQNAGMDLTSQTSTVSMANR
tara:strand:+ start:2779 stop:6819 length:4041 start_codon:yes stop_codon:yes gene_type:complete